MSRNSVLTMTTKPTLSAHILFQVLELPKLLHDDIAQQHVYLLIGKQDNKQRAQLLPDTAQSRDFLRALPSDVFFWQEDKDAGVLAAAYMH